ncbi:hypothetical protein QN277_013647 [Acacia crassicarpa]|uniref:Bacterial Ig-like domain-containing protein n=1 Tax=Acacia crassicarpa TaxID=499986 RepID=A0AAE1N3T0_9FABA|nr:hypothetical protein QN277_013647 [Acacia crassicarpa]
MAAANMATPNFLQLLSLIWIMVDLQSSLAESSLLVHFSRKPPPLTRSSNAIFQYLVKRLDGTNACKRSVCSFSCELDGKVVPCGANGIVLRNLTINDEHNFLLNVTTNKGETSSSTYSWFIDRIPPTAIISSEQTYTNAKSVSVDITFSEPCTGLGGFICLNSSNCDVLVIGPGHVLASSLKIIRPGTHYSLEVILSSKSAYGRAVIQVADNVCADQAGNRFKITHSSSLIIHFDRRPVTVDFWTSVPSYELILNALRVNSGILVPFQVRYNETRHFAFKLKNISGTRIITVDLLASTIFGRTGTPVSPVAPMTFLYDSMKPGVTLRTSSQSVTRESHINMIVEFTKPVFGFEASMVEVMGGRLIRLKELSRALYSLSVQAETQTVVSVTVPAGKVTDISGNENMASNKIEVKHYSTPAISVALHSFVSAGTIATSLVAAIFSLSSANLEAISTLASGGTKCAASSPSTNLHGMIGHLQVFALSGWFSVNQPIEYSEATRGLQWLIPHHKLPWKDVGSSISDNKGFPEKEIFFSINDGLFVRAKSHNRDRHQNDSTNSSYAEHVAALPSENNSKPGWLPYQHNFSIKITSFGQPLSSGEYFSYFLRGEPMSASNVIKKLGNYKGWLDLEKNLFWLGVGGGSLVLIHVFIILFLRWRTGISPQGSLSVPRLELLLLILMLPCISQSSTFVIKGGTARGIITGALLSAIPAAFILSVSLFHFIAIFSGNFVQYKEVGQLVNKETWYRRFWFFFTGKSTNGKWFYREGLPSSFLPRLGILFDSCKGCPVPVFVDQDGSNTHMKWAKSGQSGIGRMRAVSSDGSNKEIKIPLSKTVLGRARSFYIVLDLLRRVGLGIISVAYSPEKSSKSLLALIITSLQFIYLFTFKPYIRRSVQAAESVCLLCEVGVFGIFIVQNQNNSNLIEGKTWGLVLLVLLLASFIAQLINQWHTMITSLSRFSQPHKNSFRHGIKFAAKGAILTFLPRQHWCRVIQTSSQPNAGLVSLNPLRSETEFERRNGTGYMDPTNAMTATIVPVLGSATPSPNLIETRDPIPEIDICEHIEVEGKWLKGHKAGPRNELKVLRELAKASFSGTSRVEEASTSYSWKK